ncbi:hypothetical protein J1N35_001865 [Gossypium stocksii]|uniref:L-dopachrome isomerase n=2 Tax=Gossypium stocksii TaxID=47602 RepID=A0A9D4ALQ3_9ROSI|nr:hypothetical protein J1N35_001865 [Gossypium stocksii]
MILVNGGVPMAFAGMEAPAAYGGLISIGGLGPSVNAKLSSTVADILQTKLSIDSASTSNSMMFRKMKAEKQGYTLEEWRRGLKALRVDTVSKLRKALPEERSGDYQTSWISIPIHSAIA